MRKPRVLLLWCQQLFLNAGPDKVKRTKRWPDWMVSFGCLAKSEKKEDIQEAMS